MGLIKRQTPCPDCEGTGWRKNESGQEMSCHCPAGLAIVDGPAKPKRMPSVVRAEDFEEATDRFVGKLEEALDSIFGPVLDDEEEDE